MIKSRKNHFSAVIMTSFGILSAVFGPVAVASESIFGLPASFAESSSSSSSGATISVGALPYSGQWISEKTGSYVYLSYNSAELAERTLSVGQYVSDFGSTGYAFPGVDFFSRLVSFAGPESRSSAREFAIWGRYSLGGADRTGKLIATQTPINSAVESNSLLIVNARVGALLGFDRWNWVKPYAGMEIDPYFFRNTSDISGAELQGESFCFGPVLGAHFPILMNGRASLLAEYRRIISVRDAGQLYGNSNNLSAGMGLTF